MSRKWQKKVTEEEVISNYGNEVDDYVVTIVYLDQHTEVIQHPNSPRKDVVELIRENYKLRPSVRHIDFYTAGGKWKGFYGVKWPDKS